MPDPDAQPMAICERCLQMRKIYDGFSGLCRACYGIRSRNLRNSRAKQLKAPCSRCGKVRSSHLVERAICQACWLAEQNGRGLCRHCGKMKVIYFRSQGLCQHCYQEQQAPERLRQYVTTFTTFYPYNKMLFDLLATSIRWDAVRARKVAQFRLIGRLLQAQPLPNPLTWEAIEELIADLSPANSPKSLLLRSSFLALGHLLAAQGLLESRETYVARRSAMLPIANAPIQVQPLLQRYASSLWKRQTTPADVRKHMDILGAFWVWGQERGLSTPSDISPVIIKEYLASLSWQWICSTCNNTVPFKSDEGKSHNVCLHCGAIRSLTKVKRYSQNTVRQYRAKLRVFFAWAKVNRLVTSNPVQSPPIEPSNEIQHYPLEIIRQLCTYVASPDADPVEAFVLYLILFHAFNTWELRHVQMPDLISVNGTVRQVALEEAYYVRVPRPSPSRGKHSPGRPSLRLVFPDAAASWLKPLLARFEQARHLLVGNSDNRFVLIAQGLAYHCAPASEGVVTEIVRRASLRVLGAVCFPKLLRKTVAIKFTDQAGPGILHWLGWEGQQAFAYAWVPREVIYPQIPDIGGV